MKIKLPLRVYCTITDDNYDNPSYCISDNDANVICNGFPNQQTAQLFADCFEMIARKPAEDRFRGMMALIKRAAEAVEG